MSPTVLTSGSWVLQRASLGDCFWEAQEAQNHLCQEKAHAEIQGSVGLGRVQPKWVQPDFAGF